MGLWLEHRDENGNLVERGRFVDGSVTLYQLGVEVPELERMTLSLEEARQLARPSAHLPLGRRDWALRVLGEL